ncbi:MAG: ATP-dependent protease LonB [Candidatus Woesearchaeota archaeon]
MVKKNSKNKKEIKNSKSETKKNNSKELNKSKDTKTINSKNKDAKETTNKEAIVVEEQIDFKSLKYETTKDIPISKMMISQVIGQEDAVNVIKKAAQQRRHVLLIGEPGTGKSMLGMALAELLPKEKLVDVLALPNPNDENQPLIRTIACGKGREIVSRSKLNNNSALKTQNIIVLILAILAMVVPWWIRNYYKSDIMFAAFFLGGMMFLLGFVLFMNVGKKMMGNSGEGTPKVIVDNFDKQNASFYDATGAHAGALLGDVLHDPFQSGGLGTPANERVVAGMIHKANMGVLFIDEISTLEPSSQQDLLTALQEGKYPITGQSERSAGAMVRTEPVPCQFILVAAGNVETVQHMHPALRSRIRGYGYEVFMTDTMFDTIENRNRIAVFIAQEVHKDKKIPHFNKDAIEYIIEEARKRANRKGRLTLLFRDLGGLVRAAGDVAVEEKAEFVSKQHIITAKKIARSLEQQMSDKFIERKKEYEVIVVKGKIIGRVNGLAVIGSGTNYSGIVLPIEAEVTPGGKSNEIIATGKLGEIAKEAIQNVSAIIKKYFGEDIKETKDVYVQFLQTYEGVEGDSASIAVATTIISALKKIPIKQDYAMTGSLSVRGEVLPIGGVSAKIEAAIAAGIKNVIVPKTNMQDIIVDKEKLSQIRIIPVETITEVLKEVLEWKGKEDILKNIEKRNE